MSHRVKTVASITVEKFFDSYSESLKLSLLGDRVGFDRIISEPAVNRPGLALAGFFSYFAKNASRCSATSKWLTCGNSPKKCGSTASAACVSATFPA